MSTGANSGRSEVQGIDGAPVEVTNPAGTPVEVTVDNPCSDTEQVILTDTGAVPEQDFLRTYEYDCDGDFVGFIDTELDGSTAYAPVGPIEISVRAARPRDIEQEILCDDQGGGTVVPFIRRYRWNPNGTLQSTADLDLDGAAYVPLGTVRKCETDDQGPVTVDGTVDIGNLPDDVEILTLCDNQGGVPLVVVRFLRRYEYNPDGTLSTTVDTELDGATVYVPSGIVEDCGVSGINTVTIEGGSEQSGFGGPALVTRVFGAFPAVGSSYTTSALTRRVSVYWTSTAASLANRAEVRVDAGPFIPLANAVGTVIFGTLTSSDTMGYTLTLHTNQNSDDLLIVEEF